MSKLRLILVILLLSLVYHGQSRFDLLEEKLNQLAKDYPGINDKVELSLSAAPVQEYIRAIASTNRINVTIDPTLDIKLSNNFTNVTAKEVFIFLCKRYDLDIQFTGAIIHFIKFTPEPVPEKKPLSRTPAVEYNETVDLLSFDLMNDSLYKVAKEMSRRSGKNIIYAPELTGKTVSGFIQSATFAGALEKLAFANDMTLHETSDGVFVFEKRLPNKTATADNFSMSAARSSSQSPLNPSITLTDGMLNVTATNVPLADLVNQVSRVMGINYYLFSDLKGNATLDIDYSTYEEFLRLLFNGTELTFKKQGTTYLFGDRNLEGLRQSKLITLKNRTIEKVMDYIPAELKKGVDTKLFEDLNGIIVSGSQPRIDELEHFLRQIDIVVPMVHIEVIIADVRKSNSLSAGISAGLGAKPAVSGTTVLPEYAQNLNAGAINNLISGINGFGIINLGAVTSNFYVSLRAMETNGVLKLRSTPQIATLNGHEAKLSIGQTQYYLEVNNNLVNTNPTQQNLLQTQNWKPVTADLSVGIDPQISGDEQVTMSINVTQSSFTERVSNTAPPGTINRDFKSLIRVKNGEMIMLGGLEENEVNNSGKGLPFLSRIPVIKWLFGQRDRSKRESKLTIFIKPTIIYG